MAQLWPILVVVAIWIVVFAVSFLTFARWLRIPTDTELEVTHEHDAKAVESAAAVLH